jgi:acetylornithine aminotransferase
VTRQGRGGLPIGALIALGDGPARLLGPGDHGTTFGGNPVAAAAALVTLQVIERDGLLDNATAIGRQICSAVLGLAHPQVGSVRGEGLLLGIVLRSPIAVAVRDALLGAGIIVNAAAPDVVRLAPPLILTADQADFFVEALPGALDRAAVACQEAQQ